MDVHEARAALGVSISATPEEVRRAYLRAVKQHRPETDPEGFARVRDAFELLKSFHAQAQFLSTLGVPVPAAASIQAKSETFSQPAIEPCPSPGPQPEPVPKESTSEEARDSSVRRRELKQRFAQVPCFDIDARAKFIRDEWTQPSEELFWFTLEKLPPHGPAHNVLCECLRLAVDAGIPHALPYLVRFGSQLVREEEMGRLLNAEDSGERFLGARLLASKGQDAAMLEVVGEMLAVETVRDQAVPAQELIDLAIHCVELGRPQAAGELVKMLAGHFQKFQDENEVLQGDLVVRWALLREVVGLAPSFPARHLARVVQAIQTGLDDAIVDAASYLLESRGLDRIDETRRLLHAQAPALERVLNIPAAAVTVAPERNRRFQVPQISPMWLGLLGLTLIRLLTSAYQSAPAISHKHSYLSRTAVPASAPRLLQQGMPSLPLATGSPRSKNPEADLFLTTARWIARDHCEPIRLGLLGSPLPSSAPDSTTAQGQECRRMQRILRTLEDETCLFEAPDWKSGPKSSRSMREFLAQTWQVRERLCDPKNAQRR